MLMLPKQDFIKADALMQTLFDNSYGYVIFPNVGKGAIGIGGAASNGAVYHKGTLIGMAEYETRCQLDFNGAGRLTVK